MYLGFPVKIKIENNSEILYFYIGIITVKSIYTVKFD